MHTILWWCDTWPKISYLVGGGWVCSTEMHWWMHVFSMTHKKVFIPNCNISRATFWLEKWPDVCFFIVESLNHCNELWLVFCAPFCCAVIWTILVVMCYVGTYLLLFGIFGFGNYFWLTNGFMENEVNKSVALVWHWEALTQIFSDMLWFKNMREEGIEAVLFRIYHSSGHSKSGLV